MESSSKNQQGRILLDTQENASNWHWGIDYNNGLQDCFCSICRQGIEFGAIRIAQRVRNPYQPGTYSKFYKHLNCTFDDLKNKFQRNFFTCLMEFDGLNSIAPRDQTQLCHLISDWETYKENFNMQSNAAAGKENQLEYLKRPMCLKQRDRKKKMSLKRNQKLALTKVDAEMTVEMENKAPKNKQKIKISNSRNQTNLYCSEKEYYSAVGGVRYNILPREATTTKSGRVLPYNDFPGLSYVTRLSKGIRVHLPRSKDTETQCSVSNSDLVCNKSILKDKQSSLNGHSSSKRVNFAKQNKRGNSVDKYKLRIKFRPEAKTKKGNITNLSKKLENSHPNKRKKNSLKIQRHVQKNIRIKNSDDKIESTNISAGCSLDQNRQNEYEINSKTINPVGIYNRKCNTNSKDQENIGELSLMGKDPTNFSDQIMKCCKCSFCVKIGNAEDLSFHMAQVHQEHLFVCPACPMAGSFFYSSTKLRRHIVTNHRDVSKEMIANVGLQEIVLQNSGTATISHDDRRANITKSMSMLVKTKSKFNENIVTGILLGTKPLEIACVYCDALFKEREHFNEHVENKHTVLQNSAKDDKYKAFDSKGHFKLDENNNALHWNKCKYNLKNECSDKGDETSQRITNLESSKQPLDHTNSLSNMGDMLNIKNDNSISGKNSSSYSYGVQIEMPQKCIRNETLIDGTEVLCCTMCNSFFDSDGWDLQRHWILFHLY